MQAGLPADIAALCADMVAKGRLSAAGMDRAGRVAHESGERLDRVLISLGLVTEQDMAAALAARLGLKVLSADDYPPAAIIDGRLSARFLRNAHVLPVEEAESYVVVAMSDPLDGYTRNALAMALGKTVEIVIGLPSDIDAALSRQYADEASPISALHEEAAAHASEDIERLADLASEAPVIRLVNQLISRAVELRASDIHIEPGENRLRVRYRQDGVLRETEAPAIALHAAIVSRIKIMARLNIAETRLPQDGRLRLAVRGKEIELRVSTVPTTLGEGVVMRILDRSAVALDFTSLGFGSAGLAELTGILDRPQGIVLVTGPTGSGKTTTLYAALGRMNTGSEKILTVEDPVEYQLEGVNHVQVKPQIGLTFAHALRSFLRQDPDVIMIGEIRDRETAEIAVQAALTGHKVLSTLHTNDAASAITRLLDMGVAGYLLSSTVTGIVGQRLVRVLCPHCRRSHPAMPDLTAQLGLDRFCDGPPTLYEPVGCAHCKDTGYRGRTCIIEVLPVTDAVRALILQAAEAAAIRRAAIDGGMRTMYEDGLAKALAGTTSLEDVLRVTREG
jgi:general secretion pathway protein E